MAGTNMGSSGVVVFLVVGFALAWAIGNCYREPLCCQRCYR